MTEKKENYIFVLGSNPALSLAEIISLFSKDKILDSSREVTLLNTNKLNPEIINHLGGTIKVAQVFGEMSKNNFDLEKIIEIIGDEILKLSFLKNKKTHFGISVYNMNASNSFFRRLSRSHSYLYINLKKRLAKEGVRIAYLRSKEVALSSASVIKNKLNTSEGLEVQVVVSSDKIFLAKTIAIQDIGNYRKYDIGRPYRDLVSGTTPPKLAKIMINLASGELKNKFLDPFCGSGTFLQEAALLGYSNVYGGDLSQKAIFESRENIRWLKNENKNINTFFEIDKIDARKLSKKFKNGYFDAIASEGYLGPPLKGFLDEATLNKNIKDLENLYKDALKEISLVLAGGGKVVLVLPAFKTGGQTKYLNLRSCIKAPGLSVINPCKEAEKFSEFITERGSFIYSRADQYVLREILILKKEIK